MNHWLMKSEPGEFSIDALEAMPERTEHWDGVRNYQARNMMRDQMQLGDRVFFYHSNTEVPGIVGIAEIARTGYPDFLAWEPTDKHYAPKSTPDKPIWYMVDIRFVRRLQRTISLSELKEHADALGDFPLLRRGNRLSVMPVSAAQWDYILGLE
ncbi:EVE domain-containing protein [Plasticicumulans acidivorans]|uniref:Putative RNA-binding protein with PUA-like domain n=1 Tax=Plasticicumulans acidivorans TaxID=886464 RepID=A0A317MYQ9_9GAMM|nr:EVE domain-containing protein [Plasticicumulans acidivorans]PWV64561.1 putative RNA-binding protein with PUA-like domain [Plasticicumulans acidivorans]